MNIGGGIKLRRGKEPQLSQDPEEMKTEKHAKVTNDKVRPPTTRLSAPQVSEC
tara:strand:+ start:426 stop:584 length:159 start_codon:yes stop_codon:yes gene_type:complete